jgi:hypothetical protein
VKWKNYNDYKKQLQLKSGNIISDQSVIDSAPEELERRADGVLEVPTNTVKLMGWARAT